MHVIHRSCACDYHVTDRVQNPGGIFFRRVKEPLPFLSRAHFLSAIFVYKLN